MDLSALRDCPAWVKLIMVLSLAGNFAVLGVLIGHGLREPEHRGRGARSIDWIIGMVPEQRREFAMAYFAEARDQIEAAYVDRGPEIDAVLAAIRAEPYHPAALNSALNEMLDRRPRSRAIVRERLLSLLAEFTPAERDVFRRTICRAAQKLVSGTRPCGAADPRRVLRFPGASHLAASSEPWRAYYHAVSSDQQTHDPSPATARHG